MIDVHAHVLPGIDDGARDMQESLRLLHMLADLGFCGVIATPHYSRREENAGIEIEALTKELQQKISEECPGFSVYPGQETFYHDELAGRLKQGKALTMAGSRYVLVEFDVSVSYGMLYHGIRKLSAAGYIPVLAHIERYACLRRDGKVRELAESGCLLQMNYESLQGHWYDKETRWCRRQILEKHIDLLGTDMHRIDYRPPEIEKALHWLRQHISEEYLHKLTCGNPMKMIDKNS